MTNMRETDKTRAACSRWAALDLAVCTHPLNTRLLAQCNALIPAASLCPPFSQMTIHNTRVSTPLVGGRLCFCTCTLVTDYVNCCSQEMAIFSISPVTPMSVLQRYVAFYCDSCCMKGTHLDRYVTCVCKDEPRKFILYIYETRKFTAI